MGEVKWKPIRGFEKRYLVSNKGDVFGIYRNKLLKPNKKQNGYLQVTLHYKEKKRYANVHRLVAEAFIGKSSLQVNHKDGNKTNNCVENLEYITCSENHKHAFKNNLRTHKGSSNTQAKLNEQDVFNIKYRLIREGKSDAHIAKMYKVAKSTINAIRNNYNWSHI